MKTAMVEGQANSFEVIAREWYAKHSPNWSKSHVDRIKQHFDNDIYSWIGNNLKIQPNGNSYRPFKHSRLIITEVKLLIGCCR